ncbi:conserved hypothetical protein [Tenacibaculum sp. 190524A02b]|uniref:Phage morphogenesis protein n=1 Tax=Tenacibaculum vairaonense TaxID=3137860 RepID=A0ABP1FCV4_9FLAO
MDGLFEIIKKQAVELSEFMENEALQIIEVETLNHIEESYENEGFTDESLVKWKPRKTTDKRGKDKTRYRTNRRGKQGDLTRFGKKNKDRKTLTGHGSGGNKLRHSWHAEKGNGSVHFANDKEYAEAHNEGTDKLPKRKQAGKSKVLDQAIKKRIDNNINKILKR